MKIQIIDSMSVLRMRLENRERQLMRGVINDCLTPGIFKIWVFDGKGGNETRRTLYPAYKAHRPPVRTDIFEALYLLRKLIGLTPAWQAKLDGFEGDDLIAALVDNFRGEDVEVHSRDGDLHALGVPVIGAKLKVPQDQVRLWKLCCGDKSDNIAGIPSFGDKAWERADKPGLKRFLTKVLERRPWGEKEALAVGLTKRVVTWLEENSDELRIMWRIINPILPTPEQLDAAIVKGRDAPREREIIMEQFHL